LNGEVERDKQASFVSGILESGHTSPIEHVSFTFAIEGISRACSHQIVRHRIASYSQQSQRYVTENDMDYILPPSIAKIPEARERFEKFMDEVGETYKDLREILIANGMEKKANEDARFVLPQAAETKIVVTMNCRSLMHFFNLRCCTRAQWEVRSMADKMLKICREKLPAIFNVGGARCEQLGYCPESERFACGRFPTLSEITSKSL
jgi:thymidylate synthase (FAD)